MMKVAICDDNKVMLNYLKKIITECFEKNKIAISIITFTTGKEFIQYNEKNWVDVVFLDIKMPDMDGFQVAGKIRNFSESTYVMMLSISLDTFSSKTQATLGLLRSP